jgi:hypothetical protein
MGLPRLEFELDEHSRGKLMRASILPGIVLSATLAKLALELEFGQGLIFFGSIYSSGFEDMPDFWQRVYNLSFAAQFLQPVAVAVLFGFGIGRWGKREASWAFVFGVFLALLACIAGLFSTVSVTVTEDENFLNDVRVFSWLILASNLGLLSAGYFFLAYRGLAARQARPLLRRRRRRPPPSAAPMEG